MNFELSPLTIRVNQRDTTYSCFFYCNMFVVFYSELGEELIPTIKDVIDRRQENVRRRKKKDSLRLNVCRLFHLLASNKIFSHRLDLIFSYVSWRSKFKLKF